MTAPLKFTTWTGGSIGKPGLYADMTLEQYHSRNVCDGISISSSGLRTIFNESTSAFLGKQHLQQRPHRKRSQPCRDDHRPSGPPFDDG